MFRISIEWVSFAETKWVRKLHCHLLNQSGKPVTFKLWFLSQIYLLTLSVDKQVGFRRDIIWWNRVLKGSRKVWQQLLLRQQANELRGSTIVPLSRRRALTEEEIVHGPKLAKAYEDATSLSSTIQPLPELFKPFDDAKKEGRTLGVNISSGYLVNWTGSEARKKRPYTRRKRVE